MTQHTEKKTILITGSSGLLGSELINQLLKEQDFNVIAMTSKVKQLTEKYSNENLEILSNQEWIQQLQDRNIQVDILINCAFPRSSKPEELALGIPFTEDLIKESIEFGIKSIINISSQSVYSQKDKEDVTETSDVQPESMYGITKYACERIVELLCKQNHINYSNIRLGSLTGLNFQVRMTNRFVKNAINGDTITVNIGNQKISYLDVRDAASALVQMMKADPLRWKNTYNLGNNSSFSLLELTKLIEIIAEENSIYNLDIVRYESEDSFHNYMNCNLFYKDFNWQPEFDIKKMISELFSYNMKQK